MRRGWGNTSPEWASSFRNVIVRIHPQAGAVFLILLLLLLSRFSRVRLCGTPWIAAHQAPLSMGFSRQEYWSGVPLSSPFLILLLLLSHYSRVWFCATPSLGFSGQEHWSGLPLPSPFLILNTCKRASRALPYLKYRELFPKMTLVSEDVNSSNFELKWHLSD